MGIQFLSGKGACGQAFCVCANGALSPRMEPDQCAHGSLVAEVGQGSSRFGICAIWFFDDSGLCTYLRHYLILALLEERHEKDGINTRILQC